MEGFKHVRFGEFIDDKLTSETDSIIHQSVYNLQQRAEAAETFILPSSPHSSSSPFLLLSIFLLLFFFLLPSLSLFPFSPSSSLLLSPFQLLSLFLHLFCLFPSPLFPYPPTLPFVFPLLLVVYLFSSFLLISPTLFRTSSSSISRRLRLPPSAGSRVANPRGHNKSVRYILALRSSHRMRRRPKRSSVI